MTGLPARIAALAQLSLQDPRAAARVLFAEDVPMAARTGGLLLMAVLSTLLLQPGFALLPPEDAVGGFLAQSPLQLAVLQWVALMLSGFLIFRVGRAFGGQGSLADAILIVVWVQLILLGVQIVQILALILVPPLAGLIGLAGFVLSLWLMTHFIAELHGFRSLGRVFTGMVLTFFAAAFVIAAVVAMFLGPEALRNV
jgi:hypothetical protein